MDPDGETVLEVNSRTFELLTMANSSEIEIIIIITTFILHTYQLPYKVHTIIHCKYLYRTLHLKIQTWKI